ncbi:hypothetical protein KRP22_005745 [Phytophthora ramorum]|uniref:uncharacterized protein n=1 Tax=Phytophthora ramorum TaxID=164328 RepID=UPI003095176F|nr:hypothetical protein KRP23_3639 [Phytophthora ramorum]KAH7508030.1 hypothetical protein KRP22_3123 [Phytophthora ramorum]
MARLLLGAALVCQLALAMDAGQQHYGSFRELGSLDSGSGAASATPVGTQQEKDSLTIQPSTGDSSDSFPSTSIVLIAVGFVIFTGLVFLVVVLRRGKNDQHYSDAHCNHSHPENSRLCMKRTTFAVPEVSCTGLDEIDSSGSVVPVLGDDADHKIRESAQPELKPSWAEASAATSSYSVAPLSSRHTRPAAPMLIYAPAQGRGLNDSHTASDYSSHTDDYSIGMLESPVSTEYSFDSEGDDVFPSTDEVDSYRSMDYTFLSTTSSDVFGSNRDRKGGAWKQVYGPDEAPPIGSGLSPQSSGVLFVRQIDPHAMRRMRLDTRARRNNQMRFDVEV